MLAEAENKTETVEFGNGDIGNMSSGMKKTMRSTWIISTTIRLSMDMLKERWIGNIQASYV